jgi:hypothetical protein
VGKLAGVIAERISSQTQRPDALELGTIQDDMGLKLDRFTVPIPQGEYLVCRSLSLPDVMTVTVEGQGAHPHGPSGEHAQYSGTGIHSHPGDEGAHVHDIVRPEQLSPLKPGDRVLVAWVNGGIDPVVIDVVVSS